MDILFQKFQRKLLQQSRYNNTSLNLGKSGPDTVARATAEG
jgi:hypothetical protein